MKLKYLILILFLSLSKTIYAATPTAIAPSATPVTNEDTSVTIALSASEKGYTGAFTYTATADNKGSVVIDKDTGVAVFTPKTNYYGVEAYFKFTVTDSYGVVSSAKKVFVTINSVNDVPTAKNVTGLETEKNTPVTVDLKPYVSDIDDTVLSCHVSLRDDGKQKAYHGSVVMDESTCQATFTPTTDETGDGYFKYYVTDTSGGTSEEKKVSITIKETNHAPTAEDQDVDGMANTDSVITLVGSDEDGDELTYAIAEAPAHGEVTIDGSVATYVPESGFYGLDSFTFTVSDGTDASAEAVVNLTIDPYTADGSRERTVTTLQNDSLILATCPSCNTSSWDLGEVEHGTLSLNETGTVLTFTPEDDYTGKTSATVTKNGLATTYKIVVTDDVTSIDCSSLVSSYSSYEYDRIIYGQLTYEWMTRLSDKPKKHAARNIPIFLLSSTGSILAHGTTNDNGCYVFGYYKSDSTPPPPYRIALYSTIDTSSLSLEVKSYNGLSMTEEGVSYSLVYNNVDIDEDASSSELNLEVGSFEIGTSFDFDYSSGVEDEELSNAIFYSLDAIMRSYEFVSEAAGSSLPKVSFSIVMKPTESKEEVDDYYERDAVISHASSRAVVLEYYKIRSSFLGHASTYKASYDASFSFTVFHEFAHILEDRLYNDLAYQRNAVVTRPNTTGKHDPSKNIDSRIAFSEGFADGFAIALCKEYFPSSCYTNTYADSSLGINKEYNVEYVIDKLIEEDGYRVMHNAMSTFTEAPNYIVNLHSLGVAYYEELPSTALTDSFNAIGVPAESLTDYYDTNNYIGKKMGNGFSLYPTVVTLPYLSAEQDSTRVIGADIEGMSYDDYYSFLKAWYDLFVEKDCSDPGYACKYTSGEEYANEQIHFYANAWSTDCGETSKTCLPLLRAIDASDTKGNFYFSGLEDYEYWKTYTDGIYKSSEAIALYTALDPTPSYKIKEGNILSYSYDENKGLSGDGSQFFIVQNGVYPDMFELSAFYEDTIVSELSTLDYNSNFRIATDGAGCTIPLTVIVYQKTDKGLKQYSENKGTCPEIVLPEAKSGTPSADDVSIVEVFATNQDPVSCFSFTDEHACD